MPMVESEKNEAGKRGLVVPPEDDKKPKDPKLTAEAKEAAAKAALEAAGGSST